MQCHNVAIVEHILQDVQDEEKLDPVHHDVLLAELGSDVLHQLCAGRYGSIGLLVGNFPQRIRTAVSPENEI